MPKISKTVVDADLRSRVFKELITQTGNTEVIEAYNKINDRQYGVLLTDLNGVERYVRIGVIVSEERADMSARELMQSEINLYNETQAAKAEKKRKSAEKAERDKAKREAKKEKEGE